MGGSFRGAGGDPSPARSAGAPCLWSWPAASRPPARGAPHTSEPVPGSGSRGSAPVAGRASVSGVGPCGGQVTSVGLGPGVWAAPGNAAVRPGVLRLGGPSPGGGLSPLPQVLGLLDVCDQGICLTLTFAGSASAPHCHPSSAVGGPTPSAPIPSPWRAPLPPLALGG